jgi:aspartyl-tRNA(Asn)/glutamyl-tRNA(Gln) amidotransferase subunit C
MDPAQVKKIAGLARLELSEAESRRFSTQLTAILGYFEKLKEVATEGVPPASHPPELRSPLRPDVAAPWPEPGELVRRSAGCELDFFRVPRVLE